MKLVERMTGFIEGCDDYCSAQAVIVGIPMDYTVSFRPGTRNGAERIRTVSYGIELYSPYLDKDLSDYKYYDAGDIVLPFGNVEESLRRIEEVAHQVFADNKFPVFIGGEHLVSFPLIKAAYEKYQDLVVIHFDAHADLRVEFLGEEKSHATVIRKACDLIGGKNVYQLGIRSGDKAEFEYAKENTNMFMDQVVEPIDQIIKTVGDRPVYITLDIDVVDPAFAPGTGTPEPGGCTSKEILKAIHRLGALNVVGFDIVEVSPLNDESDRTSLLGAKLIREAILSYVK